MVIAERTFHTGATSINYADAGDGAPLVLLHGGSSRWQHHKVLVDSLAERWHVYAPDLRGHGRSGHVPGRYRLGDYADDIVAFLEHLTGPAAVFGHSLGAQVAIVVAARRPDLVTALAIGDTPLSTSTLREQLQPNRPMVVTWRDLAASDRTRQELADALRDTRVEFEGQLGRAGDLMKTDSPWFDFMAGCLRDLDPTMLDAVVEFEKMYEGFEAERLLPAIACPVLLVQADPAYGGSLGDADVAVARSLVPEIRVAHMAETGHARYPSKVVGVLRDFFSETRSAR